MHLIRLFRLLLSEVLRLQKVIGLSFYSYFHTYCKQIHFCSKVLSVAFASGDPAAQLALLGCSDLYSRKEEPAELIARVSLRACSLNCIGSWLHLRIQRYSRFALILLTSFRMHLAIGLDEDMRFEARNPCWLLRLYRWVV